MSHPTPSEQNTPARPRILACLATTLDGKIGFADTEKYVKLGTATDIHHLKNVRDLADTMVMGGKTFRAYPKPHEGHDTSRPKRHVILSQGTDVILNTMPPSLPVFQTPSPLRITFALNALPSKQVQEAYPPQVEWLDFSDQDIPKLVQHLSETGSKTLLVEGGGEVVRLFLDAHCLDELYLTLCPKIIGGTEAPSLCGGTSLASTDALWPFSLNTCRVEGDEVYLHYLKKPV